MASTTSLARRLSVAGVLLLVASGCSSTGSPDAGAGTTSTSTSAPPPPMTQQDYQALLTATEQAIRPAFDRFIAAGTLADVDAARTALVTAFDTQRKTLGPVTPPAEAGRQHRLVLNALSVDGSVRNYIPRTQQPNSCGVTASLEKQLYEIKYDIYLLLKSSNFTSAATELATLNLKFGESMFPPEPAAPPVSARRAGNGQVVQRAGPRGRARLLIKNGGETDVAVSAVIGDPANPRATIYVQAGANATLTGLSGTYEVYFKSGSDWDAGRHGFSRDCAFSKFDESFDGGSNWEITLTPVAGGNASTSDVPPF